MAQSRKAEDAHSGYAPPVMRIPARTGLPDSMCKFQDGRE